MAENDRAGGGRTILCRESLNLEYIKEQYDT